MIRFLNFKNILLNLLTKQNKKEIAKHILTNKLSKASLAVWVASFGLSCDESFDLSGEDEDDPELLDEDDLCFKKIDKININLFTIYKKNLIN